jgi:Tfp pilus assembly protein PilN
MRAVNLIPGDARRARGAAGRSEGTVYVILGGLALILLLVVVYVTASNSVTDRKAKASELQAQAAQASAEAAKLAPYAQFAQLAQDRAQTVRQLAATRFDWHKTLSDLSKVVPANTSLQSLLGTVAPGATVQGAGGSVGAAGIGSSALRGAISAPAFEMRGCTSTQNDVARLISRLRLIDGVQRVTLADSIKQDANAPGAVTPSATTVTRGATAGTVAANTGAAGCGANAPSFDLVVFFQPLQGAGPTGATAPLPQTVAVSSTGGSK